MARTFAIVNLGCPKNVVDAENMHRVLSEQGLQAVERTEQADVVIVNTCGFLDASKEESVNVLLELGQAKRPGQKLIAAGCLTQRYGEELARELPEVDGLLGTHRWGEIGRLVVKLEREEVRPCWVGQPALPVRVKRRVSTPYAYMKTQDGCSAPCKFCIIPTIKGGWRSREADELVGEARDLAECGVREIVLVAQDTTAYMYERGLRDALAPLLERLHDEVPEIAWWRIMYAYPSRVTPRLLETMARLPRVVPYLDVPLQHAHPDVLKRMARPARDPLKLITELRAAIPHIAIRSAFIVGYPGETDAEFEHLLGFLEAAQLDRVGVFTYSPEEGTPAERMPDQVPARVKKLRRAKAMALQQRISLRKHLALVGQTLDVLVEGVRGLTPELRGRLREGRLIAGRPPAALPAGRSYRDAPEVDGQVYLLGEAPVGTFVRTRIVGASEYDLIGVPEGGPGERHIDTNTVTDACADPTVAVG